MNEHRIDRLARRVAATGVPADLRVALAWLGISGGDLGRARTALLGNATGGPVLIAPLADAARTKNLNALAAELGQFARRARRQPISRTKPQPRRYRQH